CRISSMNGIAACSLGCGRSVFFRGLGKALAIASRTIRRCTFTFLATPAIVPTPNSYSRRISSNSSTLALHSNGLPLPGNARIRVSVRCQGGPNQTAEMGQFRLPKSTLSHHKANSRIDSRRQLAASVALSRLLQSHQDPECCDVL